MSSLLIIAANNNEDTSWASQLSAEDWVVIKGTEFHPPGREAYTYLDQLQFFLPSCEVVLAQGNPFNHDPDFLAHMADPAVRYYGQVHECDPTGLPECDWCPLDAWCQVLNLPNQLNYKFVAGAQYRLSPEQIKSHSPDFYRGLLHLTQIEGNRSPWVLERLWPIIWNITL